MHDWDEHDWKTIHQPVLDAMPEQRWVADPIKIRKMQRGFRHPKYCDCKWCLLMDDVVKLLDAQMEKEKKSKKIESLGSCL